MCIYITNGQSDSYYFDDAEGNESARKHGGGEESNEGKTKPQKKGKIEEIYNMKVRVKNKQVELLSSLRVNR